MSSCAVASALVVLGHTVPAAADGYNGAITGSVNYSGPTTANQATINLTNSSSVLTWTPTDVRTNVTTPIDFQSAGAVTTFVGPGGGRDSSFSVLNRVLPVTALPTDTPRGISFNGTTNALGTVLFYSPGGIIISPTARFDVGRLLLSTNDITLSENGYGRQSFDFAGASGSLATIEVQPGADSSRGLFASGSGENYVALVAPRIIQNGTVSGVQTAYVAAEAGNLTTDINVNSGLFSFAITTGTSAADALTHGGVTALAFNENPAGRAFMVAVPKNSAITMLVGGSVTYANQASVEDGAVILSTGGVGVSDFGQIRPVALDASPGTGTADITITGNGGGFTSIFAAARSRVTTTGSFSISGDADLFGGTGASFGASGGGNVSVFGLGEGGGGNVTLSSFATGAGGARTGGLASLFSTGGSTVTIEGNAQVDARGQGGAGAGSGGTATLSVTDSRLTILGSATVTAAGVGVAGAAGTGGTATVTVQRGALAIGESGYGGLSVSADGTGGNDAQLGGAGTGGLASIAANGLFSADAGPAIRIGGSTIVSASGFGGLATDDAGIGATGGIGRGGTASVSIGAVRPISGLSQGSFISDIGDLQVVASGSGGGDNNDGSNTSGVVNGGAAFGGAATLALTGGSLSVSGVSVDARASGGSGSSGYGRGGGTAGGATAGTAAMTVADLTTGTGAITDPFATTFANLAVNSIQVDASAAGGRGGDTQGFGGPDNAGAGGAAIGSRAVLDIATATPVSTGVVTVSAAATGGDGGSVFNGSGLGGAGGSGSAGVESTNLGTGQAPLPTGAYLSVRNGGGVSTGGIAVLASGTGGVGGTGAGGYGAGGLGVGGTAALATSGSSLGSSTTGNLVAARGTGGASGGDSNSPLGIGGDGRGGGSGVTAGGARAVFDGGSVSLPDLTVDGGATGGTGNVAGGNATGGAAGLQFLNGATANADIALTLNADATGGNPFNSYIFSDHGDVGAGGSGTGGAVSLQIAGGSALTFERAVALTANGFGASQRFGVGYFQAGAGTGGSASVAVRDNASANFSNGVSVTASGTGGDSFYTAGASGTGGTASFTVDTATATTPTLTLTAAGTGGMGSPAPLGERSISARQDGGAGTGGTARLLVQNSGGPTTNLTVGTTTSLDVHGTGGVSGPTSSNFVSGAVGGTGTGGGYGTRPGGAFVTVGSGGGASLADLTLIAEGTGGGSAQSGAGGSGFGGTAAIAVGIGDSSGSRLATNSVTARAGGIGAFNEAGYGDGPGGGAGGAGTGGTASLTINGGAVTNATTASFDARGTAADGADAGFLSGQDVGVGGVGIGGTASVTTIGGQGGGGTLDTGALSLAADAVGGRGGGGNAQARAAGGGATGGTASVSASTTGAITLGGNLRVSADAIGGAGGTGYDGESGAAGGTARGGSASVITDGAQIGVADGTPGTITALLSATASGGYGGGYVDYSGSTASPIGGAGADAFGGSVTMTALNGGRVALGNLAFDASASGGYGAPGVVGGNAVGGTATLTINSDAAIAATDGTTEGVAAPVVLDVHAQGGQGGGSATGGTVSLTADSGSYSGDLAADMSATATDGVDGHFGTSGGAGGSARAGSFTLDLAGSTIDTLAINAQATAGNGGNAVEAGYGGGGGAGGDIVGGTIRINAGDGSSIGVSSDNLQLGTFVAGNGGSGATGSNGTTGADGIAATATGATGGAGQKGGAGTAGGAGGRGGNATGAAITLTASLGTLTFSGGEGSASIDLTATGGIGGAGAAGGDGGAGGTGGAGGPAGTATDGTAIPAGAQGANGIQGDAGTSGDGGMGGGATGGSLILASSDQTGVIRFGDLSVNVGATGGNSGAGGGPSFGGANLPFSFGGYAPGGSATGGLVSINTGSADNGLLPAGAIAGGGLSVVSVSTPGLDTYGNQGATGLNGRFHLYAASTSNADDTSPAGSIKLDSLTVNVGGGQDQSLFGEDGAPIGISALGSNIVIANDATINTNGRVNIGADAGGQINVGDLLSIDAGQVQAFTNGSGDAAGLITANAVRYSAGGGIYSNLPTVATRSGDTAGTIIFTSGAELYAQNLTATDSISLTAGTNLFDPTVPTLTVGNIRTTAAVDPSATSLDTAGGGTISIVAGANFNPSIVPDTGLANSNIEVDGPISASNTVQLTAGGSIRVRGDVGAQVSSDNLVRIDAGDDVVIDSGAFVRAGLNPLADPAEGTGPQDLNSPAGLYITAGVQQQNTPDPANVSVVSIGGTVTSGIVTDGVLSANSADRRAIQLTGQAVQTEGGTLGARSLNVDIVAGPAPNTTTDTDLNLANGCLRGDVCLGAFDLTDRLIVGGLGDDVTALPTTVRIADGADIATTIVRAQGDILLGTDEGSSLFGGNDVLRVQSFGGAVNLLGNATLRSAGNGESIFQVLGEQGIAGGGSTLQSDGQIGLYTGSGGLTLDTLRAGSLTGLNTDLTTTGSPTLAVSGPVTITNLLAVSNGDIDISAGGDLLVGNAAVSDGFNIRLGSTGGNAYLSATTAGILGQAFDITVSSDTGDATLNNASAQRDISVSAAGNAYADQISAGDDITISGATATIGSANTTGTYVESGYGADGSNLSVTATGAIDVTGTADAFDTLRLTSTGGGGLITASTLTAGDDVFVSGAGLNIASVTSRGTSLENGYGATPDGSNIRLTGTSGAPGLVAVTVNSANAFDDLTVEATADAGVIDGGTLSAGRDATVTAGGAAGVSGGTAGNDYVLTSTNGAATGGTLSAGNDLTVSGVTSALLASGTAGRDLTLSAGGDATLTAGTAGDDIFVNGAAVTIGSATTTGTFAESGYGADGSNITVGASGDIAITGTANAFGDLTVASSGGRVTGNVLTAGDDATVSGAGLSLTSVTSRGTAPEAGYGATPDGSNIVLTATGTDAPTLPAILVTNADAAQDLTVTATNEGGTISATSLAAGRDLTLGSIASLVVTGGDAGRDFTATSTAGSVTGGTLLAGRDLNLSGATDANLDNGTAGRDLTLTAGGLASAGTLAAGDDVSVNGSTISLVSATSTGSFVESGYGSDGSNVTLTATGDVAVNGVADAFDTLTITGGGRLTANLLTAGDDVVVSAATMLINSAVSRGTSLENGYGATPDGSNIRLTGTGADTPESPAVIVVNANAFQDLVVQETNAGGAISAGTLAAGRDVAIAALSDANIGGGTAGRDLSLTSGNASASADTLAAGRDLGVTGGTSAAVGVGSAGRDLALSAGTLAISQTSLTAGDDVTVNGNAIIIGSATSTGASAETGYGADGSNVTLTAAGDIAVNGTANAFDTLTISSESGRVTADQLTAGDDAIVSGNTLSINSVVSRGTSLENGYGATPDGSNIRLTGTGGAPGLVAVTVNSANAFDDLTVQATADAGVIDGGTLSAGRDAAITAGGAAGVTGGTAGNDYVLTSTNAAVTGGTLSAGNDLTISGATTALLASGTAGRDLTLSAGGDATLTAGTAGDDIFVNGAAVTIGSATTTGAFAESGYGADGSNITVGASGDIAISGTANAFGDLTIASSGGRVTGNVLTAGDDATVSGAGLSLTSVTSRGTAPEAGYGATPDGSNIVLTANGADAPTLPAILVTTANAFQDLTLQASDPNGSIAATSLTAGRDIAGTAGGTIGVTAANAARDLSLTSTNGTLGGTSLTAGRNIAVAALGDVTIGDAIANGPVLLSSDPANPVPTSGIVSIAAGRTGGTGGYAASDVTLTGTVRAAGNVQATAGGDIIVAPTARVQSDNRITLNAGDDVLIRGGAVVSAALAPLPASIVTSPAGASTLVSPAALVLGAGTVAIGYTPAAGNVASLVVDGTLGSASRPVLLTAGAIQADASALTAGSLTVNVANAPAAGAAQSNDGGQLRLGCLQGDVCLGAVTLTGFTAGTTVIPGALTIGQTSRPTNVRVAGAVDVASIDIAASDAIYLGSATAASPIAQSAAGRVALTAGGAVNLLGTLTLTGGAAGGASFDGRTVSIDAGTDVTGSGASIVSRGPLTIDAGGSVTLASTSSGEATRVTATGGDIQIDRLTTSLIENSGDGPGSGVFLTAGGSVSGQGGNAADVDAVGDVNVRVNGDVRLGTAIARNGTGASDTDGSDIDIVAGGAVSLASGTASDDAFVTAGTDLTIGTLIANGETNNDAADTAGGNIRLAGTTIGAGTLTATTAIDARSLTFLRVDDATSPGTISFTAAGTDAAPTDGAPDGTLAVELGTVDAGSLLTIGARNGGIRFASLAAPDITLDAATRIAGGDATARDGGVSATASGNIALGTVNATGDITADAGGAFSASSLASVVGTASTNFHQIRVAAGTTLDIGTARADRGDVDLMAAGALNLGSGTAGDTVRLTSSGDSIVTGALTAGTAPATSEGYQGAIIADAGTFARIASATAPGNIAVTARGGDIALDHATAGRAITLDAATGAIGAQTLAAGESVAANARDDIAIGIATAGTAIDLTARLGAIRSTSLTSGTAAPASTTLTADADVTFGTISSTADVAVNAGGAITGDTVSATGAIDLAAGGAVRVTTDIAGDTITASGTDIALNALGDLNLATVDVTAGNVALTSSGGAVTVDRATATGAVLLASGEGVGGTPDAARFVTANMVRAGTDVTVNALGAIGVGTANAGGSIALSGAGAVRLDGGNAGLDTSVTSRDDAVIGPVTTGRNFALDAGGNATLADVTAGGLLSANATGTLAATTLRAADDIALSSGGNLSFASATSDGSDISANSGADLSFGSVDAAGSVLLAATGGLGTIDDGSITAGDSISATTGLDLTLGALSAANNLTLNAGGALAIENATAGAGILTLTAGNTLAVSGTGRAGTSVAIGAGGAVDLASIVAGTTITARSSGSALNAGTLRAGGDITLAAAGDLGLGDGTSMLGGIVLTGAAVRVGAASAAGTFAATASDTIDIAAPLLAAGRGIMLDAAGVLTANGLRATNSIIASGGGAVRLGDVESVGGTVRTVSGGSLTIGNVRAAGSIFLTAAAAVTAGNLTAGTGPILPGEGAATGIGIGGTGAGGTDLAPAGIAAGFDQSTIVRCDDCFTDPVTLPFLVNYFGNTYTTTYVSNNGYLTFNQGQREYTPTGLGAAYRGQPIISAFFADVDTRNALSSQVTYGMGTFAGRQAFGATFDNVGYYNAQGDKLNSFQIVLTNRADTGTGNFDIYYNYTKINWETGSASGGSNGFGGVSAAVGYNAGTGGQPGTFFELAGSTMPGSFLNGGTAPLVTGTNNGTLGQLVFMVRNGAIAVGGVAERPTVHVSNAGGAAPADIRLGNISAEAAEVHGSGAVTVGDVNVGDRGSGIAATGQAYATVLDAATNLTTGNIMSTGLVTLGARSGDLLGGTITTASSAVALVGGAVQLGAVTTGTGAGDSLFISDQSILADGTALPGFDFDTLLTATTFDPAALASAAPVRTGGALAVGPVTTGNLIAAVGGTATLDAIDATGAIRIDSGGSLTATSLAAGGDITATTDQNLVFASADADGSVTLNAGGTLSPVGNGTINAGGSIMATSGQSLTVGDLSAVDDLTLRSGGTLTTGRLGAGGDIDANAGADLAFQSANAGGGVTLAAAGALSSVSNGTISAGTSISATSGADLTVGSLIANTDLTLRSGGALTLGSGAARGGTLTLAAAGPLTVSGTATAGDDAVLTAGGAISTGAVTGGDTIAISSSGGDVTATDLLATNGITVRALGNLFVRDAVANAANGNVSLASGFRFTGTGATPPFLLTGDINVNGTVSAGTVTIRGGGDVLLASASRIRSDGTILIASGDDIIADAGSVIGLGAITRPLPGSQLPDRTGGPADTVTLSAGTLRQGSANLAANGTSAILMNGTVDGLAIAFNSEAVDIGGTGQVGSAATTAATFTNTGTGGTIVGGTASDMTAYALSNAALGRTRAQAIRVVAPADVVVRQLGLGGSATTAGNLIGGNASFVIATPGSVSVEGAATITSAAQTDLFAITAGNRITVLTPGGSIALNGTGGALAGRILLAAPRITVATQPAITALDGLTTLDARDERLASNDGTLSDAGFLQANALEFRVSNGLYIQNSGATRVSDTRRGFTAGTGGVTIVTTGTTPAEIAINGRQALSDGTFVTGRALIDRLTLSGTGQATMASFDPRSTVNGCLIVGMTCRFDGTAPTQPIQDVINQIINGQDDITGAISSVVQQLNSPLIDLIDFTPFRLAGIIDEPVTGAGNDDFYTSFTGDDDAMSTSVTVDEQVTGTGRDQTTDEQVTGTGKDQAGTDEQVTGTGRDQIEKSDGRCDPQKRKTDPDCK